MLFAKLEEMFNNYHVKYSPETHKLLKVLMDEAKMSAVQRQKVNDTLKRGESLPAIVRRRSHPSYVEDNLFDLKKNYYFMRRTQDQIRHSGAYERERYRLLEPLADKEKEKERLQNVMAYGKAARKNEKAEKKEKNTRKKEIMPTERIEELILEIQERLLFLDEMTNLGDRRKYEDTIKQEIAAKLREMEKLDKSTTNKYINLLEPPKKLKTNIQEVLCWEI